MSPGVIVRMQRYTFDASDVVIIRYCSVCYSGMLERDWDDGLLCLPVLTATRSHSGSSVKRALPYRASVDTSFGGYVPRVLHLVSVVDIVAAI